MAAAARPWRMAEAGLRLMARVSPNSGRDRVDGVMETAKGAALKVRVRAAPESGEANAAVESVVAQWLGLARTRVTVARGHTSRVKTLAIGGEPRALEALVAARVAALR